MLRCRAVYALHPAVCRRVPGFLRAVVLAGCAACVAVSPPAEVARVPVCRFPAVAFAYPEPPVQRLGDSERAESFADQVHPLGRVFWRRCAVAPLLHVVAVAESLAAGGLVASVDGACVHVLLPVSGHKKCPPREDQSPWALRPLTGMELLVGSPAREGW